MNSEILKAQLKILRLKILNKNHDVIKYQKGRTYPSLHTTQILKEKRKKSIISQSPGFAEGVLLLEARRDDEILGGIEEVENDRTGLQALGFRVFEA